ncbi:MAG: hypothetical protein ACK5PW_19090 [Burkholderiales bacterium]
MQVINTNLMSQNAPGTRAATQQQHRTARLAQANAAPQGVLSLLRG